MQNLSLKIESKITVQKILLLAALLILFFVNNFAASAGTLTPLLEMLTSDGATRQYRVFIPNNYNSAASVPLVFSLHGGGGGGAVAVSSCNGAGTQCHPQVRWQDLADANAFLLVYPNSTFSDVAEGFNWNDCRSDYNSGVETARDVQFISELIDRLKIDYPKIDLQRVYATGGSNGGLMSFRLAQELSHRIAAVGNYNASRPADPMNQCQPPLNPIPVVMQNGDQDPQIIYAGGQVGGTAGNLGLTTGVETTRDFWRAFNSTGALSAPVQIGATANNDDGGFYTNILNRNTYRTTDANNLPVQSNALFSFSDGGAENAAVYFYRLTNAGHRAATVVPRYMLVPSGTPPATAQTSGAENHDFNGIDEIWERIKNFNLGGERWARIDFGASVGRSFVKNANNDFVNTLAPNALWTISGDGAGWRGQSDAAHFLYRPLAGDGSLTAKLTDFQNPTAESQFALMLRTSLDANSIFYSIGFENNRLRVFQRGKNGQTSREIAQIPFAAPVFLRIARAGRIVKLSYSTDNVNFVELAALSPRISQPLPPTIYIGFAFAGGGKANFAAVQAIGNN